MSGFTTGVSGAIALVLVSGAAQFAMGRDLTAVTGRLPPINQFSSSPGPDMAAVNRRAKGDRTAGPSGSPARLQTIALTPTGMADTSVLMRIPVAGAAPPTASTPIRPVTRKPAVACEPVVSVLTEVARRLAPGRCVT
jgi:hypothetical protein